MPQRIPKFSNASTIEAKEALDGYTLVKNTELHTVAIGDNIKYAVDSVLKGGGVVKTNKFPDYIAVKNRFKSISWCVQLKEPTLQIWVRTQETDLYKSGKLVLKK